MKNFINSLILSVLAGIAIGIGGTLFLSVDNKIVGSLLFTTGLFTICVFSFSLFTGKVGYILQNDLNYLLSLVTIWIGNLLGTNLVAYSLSLTRLNQRLNEIALAICLPKLSDSYLSLFILGIFCNILMFIAVDGFKNNKDVLGKYLGLFLGVSVFILCGFEHCIADMFYFGMAKVWSIDTFTRLFVITLGNTLGGLIIPFGKSLLKN